MVTRVFDGIKFCEEFQRGPFIEGTLLTSLVQIGQAVWEENMFKEIVDTAQHTTDTRPH